MSDSQKRAWVKPAVTKFDSVDHLREHLQGNATIDGIMAVENMIDRLRREGQSTRSPEEHSGKLTAGRRA